MDDEIRMNDLQPEPEEPVESAAESQAQAEDTEVPSDEKPAEPLSEHADAVNEEPAASFEEEPAASRAGESLFAGVEEAAVDYSVAKGASLRIDGGDDGYTSAGGENEERSESAYEEPVNDEPAMEEEPVFRKQDRMAGSFSSIYSDTEGGGVYNPIPEEPVKKKRERTKKEKASGGGSGLAGRILAAVLTICLSLGAGFGGAMLANRMTNVAEDAVEETGAADASAVSISGDLDSLNAASVIAQKMMPSVVGISTVSQTLTETIFGLQSGEATGIGTGLIVSEDGYILTNSHVVNDGDAESITVDLNDGSEYEGTILWNDSGLDLAIVKIEATGLSAAELGDSDTVQIGDYALAIGNPLGLDFERSVTSGIISGLNRSIKVAASATSSTGVTMEGLIQTDASINSGNSGGPLINSAGQVIGINSAKASSAEGLGFAIPINVAGPIIQKIMETGTYDAAYIGITGYDLAAVAASLNNAQFQTESGVYINEVYQGSGAAAAGLQSGDVITAFNDTAIEGMSSLKTTLVKYNPGDVVTITYERNGESYTVDVTLGSASSASDQTVQRPTEEGNEQGQQTPEQEQEEQGGNEPGSYGGLGDLFNEFFGH